MAKKEVCADTRIGVERERGPKEDPPKPVA